MVERQEIYKIFRHDTIPEQQNNARQVVSILLKQNGDRNLLVNMNFIKNSVAN